MIRVLFIGLWVCVVTLASSYGAAYWAAGSSPLTADEKAGPNGMEYRRLGPMNVPMIIDGSVRGYVVAKFVFTAEAATLRKLGVDPQPFVTSAAFEEIYTNGRIDTGQLSKYNLKDMLENIKNATNNKLNGDIVKDVLLDGINYVDRNDMKKLAEASGQAPRAEADKAAKPTH